MKYAAIISDLFGTLVDVFSRREAIRQRDENPMPVV